MDRYSDPNLLVLCLNKLYILKSSFFGVTLNNKKSATKEHKKKVFLFLDFFFVFGCWFMNRVFFLVPLPNLVMLINVARAGPSSSVV
jgi:hypothetical protein